MVGPMDTARVKVFEMACRNVLLSALGSKLYYSRIFLVHNIFSAGDIPNSNGECIPLNLGRDAPYAEKPQVECEAPLFDGSDSDAPYLVAHEVRRTVMLAI
jgi:hypothetical protein